MRLSAPLLLLVVIAPASGEVQITPEPTALEAFVSQSATAITRSRLVGQIHSDVATVAVSILQARNMSDHSAMEGVRIDLVAADRSDTVFVERDDLPRLIDGVEQIERDIDDWRIDMDPSIPSCLGAAEFWAPVPVRHSLSAAFCNYHDWWGLSLGTYSDHEFNLPSYRPADLATLLRQADVELVYASRSDASHTRTE